MTSHGRAPNTSINVPTRSAHRVACIARPIGPLLRSSWDRPLERRWIVRHCGLLPAGHHFPFSGWRHDKEHVEIREEGRFERIRQTCKAEQKCCNLFCVMHDSFPQNVKGPFLYKACHVDYQAPLSGVLPARVVQHVVSDLSSNATTRARFR